MQHIQNGRPAPEVIRYQYRKMFGLSAREVEQEPLDEMSTNLFIDKQIALQEMRQQKHG